jgi:hypothetical protein
VAQPLVQAALAHACGVQSVVAPGTHCPALLHLDVATRVAVPGVQAAGAQVVPAG